MPETPRPALRRGPGRPRKARPALAGHRGQVITDDLQAAPSVEVIGVDLAAGPDRTAEFSPTPEAAAQAWLDQVADPAAPGDGQADFLRGMFAAEPQEPQEEHEDGQADAPAGAMPEMPGSVDDGHGSIDGASEHETAELGQPGEVSGMRDTPAAGEQEQHPAPEALAEAEPEGQAPGDPGAATGRSAAGGVGEAAPASENPALAILAGVVADLCGKGIRRTSLRFLQSEFNAVSPADLAVRSPEAMAHLVALSGLRQVAHRGEPGVILAAVAEVRP